MEKIDFKVSVTDVIRFLGIENFETKESAIYELVKNSYDAEAKNLKIIISNNEISIIDDGIGMDKGDIVNKWMMIGQSHKREIQQSSNRVYTGEKGIGRLALARLGTKCELYSKTETSSIYWETDWNTNTLSETINLEDRGTKIIVKGLMDKWTSVEIDRLKLYLTKSIKSEKLNIQIVDLLDKYNVPKNTSIKNVFSELEANKNYFIDFNFSVNNRSIEVNVNNKLFEKTVMSKLNLDEKYVLKYNDENDEFSYMNGITGQFYYGFRIFSDAKVSHSYRPNPTDYEVPTIYTKPLEGIILYRNDFSVQGYDGSKDWANLSDRARRNNKGPSDKGRTSFRKNNIFGYIDIDYKKHKNLKDLSNRQGLVQNDELDKLIKLVDVVFDMVEDNLKYKFYIPISEYNTKQKRKSFKNPVDLKKKLDKELDKFNKLTQEEKEKKYKKDEEKRFTFEIINDMENEKRAMKHDLQSLETYSSQSLLINSITHDLKNSLTVVGTNPTYIKELLQDYGYETILIEKTKDNKSYRNYKQLIESLEGEGADLNLHLIRLLEGIKRDKFNVKTMNLENYMKDLIKYFELAFSNININLNNDVIEDIKFYETTLDVIFNNLIDNSRKNNKDSEDLIIDIKLKEETGKLFIEYEDNGVGLADEFKSNPNKILDNGITTHRETSTGLGMWIINRKVKTHNGKLDIDPNYNGFKINIELELK